MTDYNLPRCGAVLIVSENVDPIQLTRAAGHVVQQMVIDQVVVVNRSWSNPVQDQITRLPRLYRDRLFNARTSDPVQELARRVPDLEVVLVVDAMATLKNDTVTLAAAGLVGPGSAVLTGAITTKPRWVGGLYRLEAFLNDANGIDLADHRSRVAALKSAGWIATGDLEILERPLLDLGPETFRRLPDRLAKVTKPFPRAGKDEITFTNRRRSRR